MVQFQFQLGQRHGGGIGVRTVPIYAISDWRAGPVDDGGLIFRPSWRTVRRRLGITLLAGVVLGLLAWSIGVPWQEAEPDPAAAIQGEVVDAFTDTVQNLLETQLPPENRAEFAENVEQIRREHQERLAAQQHELSWLQRLGRAVHWTLFDALIALGLVPLILAAWERVDLRNGPDGELIVRRRRFLTRERRWPRGSFGGVICEAAERIHHTRREGALHSGWFWIVRLLPRHRDGGIAAPTHIDDPMVEFHVARQPDRPLDEKRPPKRVRTFLKHVCRLADIDPRSVQFGIAPDAGSAPRGFWERRRPRFRKRTVTYTSEPIVESTEYGSIEEMPPELQEQVRQLMKRGIPAEGIAHESIRITVRDADGTERTYTSLDDLPPDLRTEYEAARRKALDR